MVIKLHLHDEPYVFIYFILFYYFTTHNELQAE